MEEKNDIRLREDFKELWSISSYEGDSPLTLRPAKGAKIPALTRHDITDIPAAFIADPFMIQVNETWFMFLEILNAETELGEIGLATSSDGINWEYQQVVLKEDYHLSYPFVFEFQGEYYMTPETPDADAIRLYKTKNFPYDWEHVTDLAKGQFADPTLFQHNEKWWMFAASNPYESNTLNLFYADQLTGPYLEHPKSPLIENDRQHARPAGRIIQQENKLIRLCQDCYPMYGTKVRAFEILELTTDSYKERELLESPLLKEAETTNQWNSRGMHHLDAHQIASDKWLACVDGCFYDKPMLPKRAVWIFDDTYKIPTFLSVASFREHTAMPITLVYTGAPKWELMEAFKNIGGNIEFIIKKEQSNAKSRAEHHRDNRLARMEIMRQWPEEQVYLFDGDLIFSDKIKGLIPMADNSLKNNHIQPPIMWGVPEYDPKFYTEKRDENGNSTYATEDELHQCLFDVFGNDWQTKLGGTQYNNGMLIMYNCAGLADAWEENYLRGLEHPLVNPEDDQLPLCAAMFDKKIHTIEFDRTFNSLGMMSGEYAVYHAWNGKWKKELTKILAGETDLEDYGKIAKKHYQKMPAHWLQTSEPKEVIASTGT